MDCLQANELLGAWVDGELDSGELDARMRAALDAHLAACVECRTMAELFRAQDADLRRALVPQRRAAQSLAERVTQQLPNAAATVDSTANLNATPKAVVPQSVPRPNWLPMLLSMAAGFLLAALVFRPWERPREVVKEVFVPIRSAALPPGAAPEKKPLVQLAVATGPVEVLPANNVHWMTCPSNAEVEARSCIRTGPNSRCEFSTPGGSHFRMNADTEVRLDRAGQMELTKGRIWSCVREGESPLAVSTANATVTSEQGKFDLSCENGKAVLTVVDGTAILRDRQGERTVEAGQRITLVNGQVTTDQWALDALLDTSWMHEVLALKGRDDPEYTERMNQLLARIGQAKLSILYEEEIRRQGDHCVPPLVQFLQSPESQNQTEKRRRAARIVADVAQPRSIPELVLLLSDDDPFVRRSAAEGLLRLTSHDQGRPPMQWQNESATACEPTVKLWHIWLDQRRDRIPGATPRGKALDAKELKQKS